MSEFKIDCGCGCGGPAPIKEMPKPEEKKEDCGCGCGGEKGHKHGEGCDHTHN